MLPFQALSLNQGWTGTNSGIGIVPHGHLQCGNLRIHMAGANTASGNVPIGQVPVVPLPLNTLGGGSGGGVALLGGVGMYLGPQMPITQAQASAIDTNLLRMVLAAPQQATIGGQAQIAMAPAQAAAIPPNLPHLPGPLLSPHGRQTQAQTQSDDGMEQSIALKTRKIFRFTDEQKTILNAVREELIRPKTIEEKRILAAKLQVVNKQLYDWFRVQESKKPINGRNKARILEYSDGKRMMLLTMILDGVHREGPGITR